MSTARTSLTDPQAGGDAPPGAGGPASVAPHRRLAAAGLVAVMAVGSILMWLAVPVGWLWVGSRMTSSTQAELGPYVLVLAGTVISMVVFGKALGTVNRLHLRVSGRLDDRRRQATWMRSMRGERKVADDRGVLDRVMFISVGLALFVFAIWFFGFAGSSLPGS